MLSFLGQFKDNIVAVVCKIVTCYPIRSGIHQSEEERKTETMCLNRRIGFRNFFSPLSFGENENVSCGEGRKCLIFLYKLLYCVASYQATRQSEDVSSRAAGRRQVAPATRFDVSQLMSPLRFSGNNLPSSHLVFSPLRFGGYYPKPRIMINFASSVAYRVVG